MTAVRVLFSTTAGSGHFRPLVPFAQACVGAGHEVLVASPASFRGEVERAGFQHLPFADAPEDEWAAVRAKLGQVSPEEATAMVLGEVFAGMDARSALPGLLEGIEGWRPDLVLRESCELGSSIAADRLDVPQARVGVSLGHLDEMARPIFAASLAPLRRSVGLDDDRSGVRLASVPYLTFTPPLLDSAAAGPDGALRFRGGEAPVTSPTGVGEGWWPNDLSDRPIVYVTFGTVAGTIPIFAGALPRAVEALSDLDVRLLVTLGGTAAVDRLGHQPPNVHVAPWVDEAAVLPRVAGAVSHGGYGSVLRMLSAGVPLVVAPQFGDQPANAAAVAAAGAGVALPPGMPDDSALRKAVEAILGDATYRRGAEAVAADAARLPVVDEAVPHLERHAGLG